MRKELNDLDGFVAVRVRFRGPCTPIIRVGALRRRWRRGNLQHATSLLTTARSTSSSLRNSREGMGAKLESRSSTAAVRRTRARRRRPDRRAVDHQVMLHAATRLSSGPTPPRGAPVRGRSRRGPRPAPPSSCRRAAAALAKSKVGTRLRQPSTQRAPLGGGRVQAAKHAQGAAAALTLPACGGRAAGGGAAAASGNARRGGEVGGGSGAQTARKGGKGRRLGGGKGCRRGQGGRRSQGGGGRGETRG